MPTYEYRCPAGHQFEVFQRISEPPGAACPTCGADAQRQISAGAGFLFKGDGFYITDHRSADYKKKASSDGGAPAPAKESAPAADKGGSTPSPSSSES